MREFITELDDKTQNVQLFTTVTTKAEYLEYYRRKILTESIFEIVKRNKTETILSDKARIEIEKQIRARNVRQSHEIQRQEKFEKALQAQMIDTTEIEIEEFSIDANYFKDSEIKEIKKAFRARDVGKEMGWISSRQIESARRAITHYTARGGRLWIKLFPDKTFSFAPLANDCMPVIV